MANSERIYLIQGNDTDMSVCLRKGGDTPLPYDLTGASRIGLALTGHGLSFFARDIVVSGEDNNIISGLLAGDLLVGEYGLEVSFTLDGKAKRFRVPQVFEVVTYLSEDQDGTAEGEGDGISITVTVQPEVIEIAGPTGPQGHDGKSAYEVWLDEGHTGDEDDFFRWLAAQTPNPDWAQNDASEPDYVENRTHYTIPAVSLPDAFITFRWTEEDYSDLMFYLNDETPMPRVSENVWGVQLGQWLLSCYINGNVLDVDLDGDPILTVANFRPGRTPQPILVGDIEVPELVQQLDGKYLGLKTVNGQSVKGSGDITLNGSNLEYTGDDGEYISGGDSINGSLLLLDEAVDETNGRLDNLKGSQVVYDGEDGDSVIVHGDTVDQCLKGLDDQAAYVISNYQYKINDLDTIRAGAALGATAYQKPSTGIPKSALASAVKTSLEKADTALQPSALDGYATEDYVDEEVSGKQDTLISGENIKTINGQSVLGEGDIVIQSGSADAVKYTEQTLTDAQKAQARTNIAAASDSEVSRLRSEVNGEETTETITRYARQSSCVLKTDGTIITTTSGAYVVDTFRGIIGNTKYIISGRVGVDDGLCLCCFYDVTDSFIAGSAKIPSTGTATPYNEVEVTSPSGAVYMRICGTTYSALPYEPTAKVVIETAGISGRIEAIENEIKIPAFDISRLAYDEIYGFYIAGSTNKWVENNDGVTYIYRVRGGKKMTIVGNAALDSNYAFLTDYVSPVAGSYPSFIPGYEQTYNISSNATIEVVPPIDCYMAVNCATSPGGIRYPQHIYIPGDNPFWGLKSIWQGPSTMYGLGTIPLRSRFSSRVAQFFGMSETNYGVSGSTIAKKAGSYESAFGSLAEFNAAVAGGLVDTSKRYLVKDNVSDILPWTIYYYNGSDWVSVQRTVQNVERAPMVDRLSELDSDADVVVFQGSTNDFMYDWAEIGGDTDRIKTTIKGAVHLICQHLVTAYPHKFIIWINGTCSYRYQGEYTTPFDKNNLQYSGWEEWDAVKEVLKQYSIPFIDMAGECGLTPENSTWWNDYDSEGTRVHPNHLGHLRLAKYLVSKMLMLKGLAK